jgi:hypothetical protein
MISSKFTTLFHSLLLFSVVTFAQELKKETPEVSAFKSKVAELYAKYKSDGFVTYKGSDLPMENRTEFPIYVELKEGSWYGFIVVGDPNATKFEMKLGLEGIGDIITDKFKVDNTNEYWTNFSFICPRSGKYLFTFYQRGASKKMLGHVGILEHPCKTKEGNYTFKH